MRTLMVSLAASLLVATAAIAGECDLSPAACGAVGCETGKCRHDCTQCPRCGTDMVCKVVVGTKEIKKTVWNVKCEPICLANPSLGLRGCDCGDSACGGTGCTTEPSCGEGSCGKGKSCDPCAVENDKEYNTPRCGKVRVKKTLEKKEVICKVPSYKCVPTCPSCGNCGTTSCSGEGAVAPAPKSEKAAPLPAAPMPSKTTLDMVLPPVVGASYTK